MVEVGVYFPEAVSSFAPLSVLVSEVGDDDCISRTAAFNIDTPFPVTPNVCVSTSTASLPEGVPVEME